MRSAANNDESQIPRQRGERFIMSSRCVTAEASVLSGVVVSFYLSIRVFVVLRKTVRLTCLWGEKRVSGSFLSKLCFAP